MSDTEPVVVAERSASGAFIAVVIVAVLLGVGALGWCFSLQSHATATDAKLAAADKKNADLADQLEATKARLSATTETLSQNVGATQKQIDARTATHPCGTEAAGCRDRRNWRCRNNRTPRSRSAPYPTNVASVKTDVGGSEDGCCHDQERPGDDQVAKTAAGGGRCRGDERA